VIAENTERPRPDAEALPLPRIDRLRSLDVFRGATIAAMILVNNAGDWDETYWPLVHAEWQGDDLPHHRIRRRATVRA